MSEMTRPVPVDRIGAAGAEMVVEATAAELPALAARLQLPAMASLRCEFRLKRVEGSTIAASGSLRASVTRECVVSLDEFAQDVVESFEIRFVPEGAETDSDDLEAPDEVPYAGGAIDLGEAAVEQLALALEPYPRKPGLPEPDADDDATAPHPFAALAGLRRPQ